MENGYRIGAASGLTRLLFLAFLLLCLSACGNRSSGNAGNGEASQGAEADSGGASENKAVRIGVIEPLTGEKGAYGLQEALGIRYASQQHPTVTLDGETYQIELLEADNRSDSSRALDAARELLEQDVSIVLGSYGTELSIAAGEAFQEAGVPFIACSCTNPALTKGNAYAFQACFQDPFQAAVLADYCIQHSYKKAVILCLEDDLDSTGLGTYFKEAFLQLDGTVLGETYLRAVALETAGSSGETAAAFSASGGEFSHEGTSNGEISDRELSNAELSDGELSKGELPDPGLSAEGLYNYEEVFANIASQDPDMLFAALPAPLLPPLLRKAREGGLPVLFAGGTDWELSSLLERAGADAGGVVFTSFFDEAEAGASDGLAAAFSDGFRAYLLENGESPAISPLSALGYDAYLAALSAIEAAGSTEGEAIREALYGVSLEGAAGSLSFDQDGNAQGRDKTYIKTVREGRFVTLSSVSLP